MNRPRPRAVFFAALADLVLVLAFATIGRASHTETLGPLGVLETAWPFLAGLAVGWLLALAWRRPFAVLRTGIPLWIAAVAIGMLLRLASGQGTQLAFVIVATLTLGLFLLGWRALAALVGTLRRRSRTA